ncbi:MAG: Ig-like domain-containing protein [Xanthomonadales bacterium]|nr:Ig-like domain-containing protein [Xanthomonadales bacterium]
MNLTARNSILNPTVAIVAVIASATAFGQLDTSKLASDVSLVVDGGSEILVMPILTEDAQDDVVTYDLGAGEVRFDTGVLSPGYDEPLFCFDLGTPSSAVKLEVLDPNGHVIIDQFDLKDPLAYSLEPPLSLTVGPASDQQCFYRSSQDVFGLFGAASASDPEPSGLIFSDRLEVDRSLELEYQGVPDFVTVGETFSYDLVVTNSGTGALQTTALQELFPENLGVYSAALTATTWTCSATGDAVCPAGSGTGPLRFNEMNGGGIDLTVGDSLTFNIVRTVAANSVTGETIQLHAGTVADPVATGAAFAVAEALMTVIGQSAGLSVSATDLVNNGDGNALADGVDSSAIAVTVFDGNGNPVPGETVTFDSSSSDLASVTPASGVSGSNGQVVFDSGTTTTAGNYNVAFSADGGALTGSGTVTFDHGPAAIMVAAALDSEAVADGTDAPTIDVLVEDAFGNAVDSVLVEVTDGGGLASPPPSEYTDINGGAIFTPTSTVAGTYQIQFSVAGAGSDAVSVDFLPGAATDLAFISDPTDTYLDGSAMAPVVVRVVDDNGNWVADDQTTTVQLRLRQNGVTIDSSFADAVVVNGEAEFTDLLFSSNEFSAGLGYSFRAVGTTDSDIFFVDSIEFELLPPQ